MKKKTAVITGASRGIGAAIAEAFAQNGYDLMITCKESKVLLNQLQERLSRDYAVSCRTFIGDISQEETVKELFASVTDIDVLVNNAGISYVGLLHDMDLTDWNHVISTNLTSVFLCSKYAIPLMLKKKCGQIINISSVWGNVGASTEVAYSASKGGINAFTRALAKELAPSGIQVNALACGMIDTDMNRHLSQDEVHTIIEEIPADRIGQPSDVAAAVLSLCTGLSYLTGQIISVDGGWT